jgi:hypothetical protein
MMNWERIWKDAVMAEFKYCSGICLERLRKTVKYFGQDSWCPIQDLNQATRVKFMDMELTEII